MQQAPGFSSPFGVRYITGPGAVDERTLIWVDFEKLMLGSMVRADVVH